MNIDAHQHFWKYSPEEHGWIDDSMKKIQRDFLPVDLKPVLDTNNIDGCVLVQVNQSEEETGWFVQMADENDFIKGVVGWVNLQAENIEERLARYKQSSKLKGFRHIVQGEKGPQFLYRPSFRNGIRYLKQYNFTYDILIYPHQLKMATDFVAAFPDQQFVLDHLAKPYIRRGLIDEWKNDIEALASFENVWCKISGLVTEADWEHHKVNDFIPYIEAAIEAFGTDRLMFGSDWPVCLVAATYEQVLAIAQQPFQPFSAEEKAKVFGLNAVRFYNLDHS